MSIIPPCSYVLLPPLISAFRTQAREELSAHASTRSVAADYGTRINKFKSDLSAWQTEQDRLQERFDFWTDVAEDYQRKRAKAVESGEEVTEQNESVPTDEQPDVRLQETETTNETENETETEDSTQTDEEDTTDDEVIRTAAHFPMETPEEASDFDKRVPKMKDSELLAYMREDGNGDVNKAHHPSIYDEYDYRHGDEISETYDIYLQSLHDSGTTLEQAEEMLSNLQKELTMFATKERATLLGQEEALQEYITSLENMEGENKSDNEEVTD